MTTITLVRDLIVKIEALSQQGHEIFFVVLQDVVLHAQPVSHYLKTEHALSVNLIIRCLRVGILCSHQKLGGTNLLVLQHVILRVGYKLTP